MRGVDEGSDGGDSSDDEGDLNPRECTPTAIPREAFGNVSEDFVQVVALDSACFALTSTGSVYGWGTFRVSHLFAPTTVLLLTITGQRRHPRLLHRLRPRKQENSQPLSPPPAHTHPHPPPHQNHLPSSREQPHPRPDHNRPRLLLGHTGTITTRQPHPPHPPLPCHRTHTLPCRPTAYMQDSMRRVPLLRHHRRWNGVRMGRE